MIEIFVVKAWTLELWAGLLTLWLERVPIMASCARTVSYLMILALCKVMSAQKRHELSGLAYEAMHDCTGVYDQKIGLDESNGSG